MNKPPDYTTTQLPNIPMLRWDPTKTCNLTSTDPIYLLMTRTNSTETLKNVSPFLIQKAIDATCGEILKCKKILSGQILLETKNSKQANKLTTLIALSNTTTIEITPHPSLNSSKGVIYCNDLRNIPEEEILHELSSQNVSDVKKIYKKVENQLTETGLIILTFNTTALPTKMNIGYLKVSVRPYIPPPMRCKNCSRYNHLAKYCNNPKTCPTCANNYHINDEINELCKENKKCVNCVSNNYPNPNHSAFDKKCPIFIKEKEIQIIKVTSKVDNRTAKTLYKQRHPPSNLTYATAAAQPNTPTISTSEEKHPQITTHHGQPTRNQVTTNHQTPTSQQTIINAPSLPASSNATIQLLDKMSESDSDSEIVTKPKQSIKILPKNIPKRLRSQLKKPNPNIKMKTINKIQQNNNKSEDIDFNPFDI